MNLKDKILLFILKGRVNKMLDKIKNFASGKMTYITAALGIIVTVIGVVFGPLDLGNGVVIPHFELAAAAKIIWVAALALFGRRALNS